MTKLSVLLVVCSLAAGAAPKGSKPIGSAKEDDSEAVEVARWTESVDLALQSGLLQLFEPAPLEVRVRATENMGLLQDPRALNALAQLTLDPNPSIALAAVRAVGLVKHPRAEAILTNLLFHPAASDLTKRLALRLLPFQNSPSCRMTVYRISTRSDLGYELSALARSVYNECR